MVLFGRDHLFSSNRFFLTNGGDRQPSNSSLYRFCIGFVSVLRRKESGELTKSPGKGAIFGPII